MNDRRADSSITPDKFTLDEISERCEDIIICMYNTISIPPRKDIPIMKDETLRRAAYYAVLITFAGAALFLLLRHAPGVVLPFAAAYLISRPVRAAARFLARSRKGAEKLWCVLLIIAAAWGLMWLIWRLMSSFTGEIAGIAAAVNDQLSAEDGLLHRITELIDSTAARFPLLFSGGDGEAVFSVAEKLLSSLGSWLSSFAASAAAGALSSVPGLIFAFFATVAALFYMCLGSFELSEFIYSMLPESFGKRGGGYVRRITSVLGRYLKAYGTIMLLTFAELLLGTVILRVDYALAVSAMIAVIDILPVLGVGTVLVPWSVISFIMGDSYRGVGLLILFGVIYAVRQIAEPRILSDSMGMNPLAALFSVYAGFKLFGVWGMILAPMITCVVIEMVKLGRKSDVNSGRCPEPH